VPHFAVVDTLKKKHPSIRFHYIGSRRKLDADLVKTENLPFTGIFAGKLRRYFSWQYLLVPFLTLMGFFQSLWVITRFRPQVVFSKGGYVSFPVALAAFLTRRPLVLHESDSVMGISNRVIARLAKKVCVSFPALEQKPKYVFTGNPVRLWLKTGSEQRGQKMTGFNADRPTVLIWGGSQGAQQINQMVQKEFEALVKHFYIIHITGQAKLLHLNHPHYKGFDYVGQELRDLYAITDLAVGRAGANSLFEMALMQKPYIVMPLKNADQQANATYFVQEGAGVMFNEDRSLVDQLKNLIDDPLRMKAMKKALKKLAPVDAAERIGGVIEEFLK